MNIQFVTGLAITAIAIALIAVAISALRKPKPLNNKDYLELEEGDLVIVDDAKVTVRRFGAIAVEKTIQANAEKQKQGDTTITFKAGRKVQKISIH